MHPLDHIRFEPERSLIDELFERFSLEAIVVNYEQSGEGEPTRELIYSTQLRLTPLLAPRLYRLFEEVKEKLRFEEPVELFVQSNSDINGFSLHTLTPDKPHIVSLTSGMIERMNDDELRFVLGHELGHLHFRHHRPRLVYAALVGEDDPDEELAARVPPLLQRRMESWERLAELSADRAGFVAIEGRLEPVVSAFFKLTSGLGPEHLRFDIEAFLNQLGDLMKLKRREVLAQFSHPATPVRVRALQLYGAAGGGLLPTLEELHQKRGRRTYTVEVVVGGLKDEARVQVDAQVGELAQLMDFEVTEPLELNARDFLVSAGMLAVHANDEEMTRQEHELLVQFLLPLTADPEALFVKVGTEDKANELLAASASWLRENAGEERFALYRQVAHLVAVDGVLDPHEKAFMLELAKLLDIPSKAAMRLVYEVLADYLQSRPWDRKLHFRTRPALKKKRAALEQAAESGEPVPPVRARRVPRNRATPPGGPVTAPLEQEKKESKA